MNNEYNYFNLYSARNKPRNKHLLFYNIENISPRLSTSINKRRNNSPNQNKKTRTIDSDQYLSIKNDGIKRRENSLYSYIGLNKNRRQINNTIQNSSSASNLNKIQNNIELKQRDLMIDKLHNELYKKNHQIFKQNNLISVLKKKILSTNKNERKNINNISNISNIGNIDNNLYQNNKLYQLSDNDINNLKITNSITNKELTNKLKEQEENYKTLINSYFNSKFMKLENKNSMLTKQNKSLINKINDIKKNIYNSSIKTSFRKFLFIKPIREINLAITKRTNFINFDRNKRDDNNNNNIKKIITQYKLKISKLNNEVDLLKSDIQIKNKQILNVKNENSSLKIKFNEIINDNKKKEIKINNIKNREIENKNKEINDLNSKLDQLLYNFEKEKNDKEKIQKLYERSKGLENNYINEIENTKSNTFLSNDYKLSNISSLTHRIIFSKKLTKYKLSWYLITLKNENEIKNYINTFWISEEDMQQINGKMSFDKINVGIDSDIDLNEKDNSIENININNEEIKKLKDIIEEKEKLIKQLENKLKEKQIINNFTFNNENNNIDNDNDKKGFISIDKYIKIVNQLSEAKKKISELTKEKTNINKNSNIQEVNSNISGISKEFSDFIKNDENGNNMNNIKIYESNKNNMINMNNTDSTNKYLEKYIDDLENKINKIKSLIKQLIEEMEYTSNLNNTLYNLLIVSGYDDQEAVFIIQEKQKKTKKLYSSKK